MIIIEIPIEEKATIDKYLTSLHKSINYSKIKKFDGSQDILQIAITLTSITIPFIAKIIIELIRSKKPISVKFKGREIKEIICNSEEEIKNILKIFKKIKHNDK